MCLEVPSLRMSIDRLPTEGFSSNMDTSAHDEFNKLLKQGRTDFDGMVFDHLQIVRKRRVDLKLSLHETSFKGGLEMSGCTFRNTLFLSATDFGGKQADFGDCKFEKDAIFRPRNANHLSLRSCEFRGKLEVAIDRVTRIDIDLRHAQLFAKADIGASDYGTGFYSKPVEVGKITAAEITIGKESTFEISGIEAALVDLSATTFQDKASLYINDLFATELHLSGLRAVDKATISLNHVALEGARFYSSNIERIAFLNARWPRTGQRIQLLDERELRTRALHDKECNPGEQLNQLESVTENYRQLVLNHEAKRNYTLAEAFHLSEMEMMRLRATLSAPPKWRRLSGILNAYSVYSFVSKYGSSYLRAASVLIALMFSFSVAFMLNGVSAKNGEHFEYNIFKDSQHEWQGSGKLVRDFGAAVSLTFAVVTLQKERPLDPVGLSGSMISSVLTVLAPAQAALMLFALRRKFRRASI